MIALLFDTVFWTNFWPNLWSNLIANFLVGIVLAGIIGWIIRKREKVSFAVGATLRSISDGGTMVYFNVINEGNVVARRDDVHYHIFVKESLIPTRVLERYPQLRRINFAGSKYVEIRGTLETTIFPKCATTVASIELRSIQFEFQDFAYYLSTAKGLFPTVCKIDPIRKKISHFGAMAWIHVFDKDGKGKVHTVKDAVEKWRSEGVDIAEV